MRLRLSALVLITVMASGCRVFYDNAEGCGDGDVDLGEICDDGNDIDGDGCSSQCTLEVQGPGGSSCANRAALFLVPTAVLQREALARGDTSGGTDAASPSCESSDAPQDVYTIELTETSDVFVSVDPTGFAPVLYLRGAGGRGCLDEIGEIACTSGTLNQRRALNVFGVDPGIYFLFVDADQSGAGSYELQVLTSGALRPPPDL